MPPSSRTPEERFALFVRRVEEMVALRAFREQTIASSFNLRFNGTDGGATFDTGDGDDLRSALLTFRKFTQKSEDVHVESIANLVEQHVTDERCRQNFRGLRSNWVRARRGTAGLNYNGQELDAFDLIVNGQLFHDDPAKEALLEAIPQPMRGMLETNVSGIVIEGAEVLWRMRNNLKAVLAGLPVVPDAT